MLIEIMVAFALMCLTALLIAHYQGRIIQNGQLARDTAQATAIASSALEDLLRDPDDVGLLMRASDKFTVVKEFKKIENQSLDPYQLSSLFLKDIASVAIKVSWGDKQNVTHELVFYSVVPVVRKKEAA